MNVVDSLLPLLACLASLIAVPAIAMTGRSPNVRDSITLIAGFAKFALVLAMVGPVLKGAVLRFTFIEILPNVAIEFRVDGLGILFALVASSLWILTSIYALGYMRGLKEHDQTRFFAFFALSLSATLGVAFAGNLLTLYLFYEMLSLSTWPLVTHHGDKEARSGGRTYLTYLLGTSIGFVLPAMIYCYIRSGGDMTFTPEGFLGQNIGAGEGLVLLLLFTFGFAKAGLMPFHSWLPNAMVAPTPVSALLHAVAVVKVGVFCVIRVFTGVFGTESLAELDIASVVSWIAGITIVLSSLIALTQDNLKRRLAFSTIGQLAYIVLGVSFLSANGVLGASLHIVMHAFGKITLFFCAGAIFVASGKKYVSQLGGIGRRMPWTMTAFALASLSIIGLPPFGGAWSKWFLFLGGMDAGQYLMVGALIFSSLLNIAYLVPIVIKAFLEDPAGEDRVQGTAEAPFACVFPLCVTALSCFILFFFPGFFRTLVEFILP